MPVFDPERMQQLYLLTIPVVIGLTLLGLVGVEKRRRGKILPRPLRQRRSKGRNRRLRRFFGFCGPRPRDAPRAAFSCSFSSP